MHLLEPGDRKPHVEDDRTAVRAYCFACAPDDTRLFIEPGRYSGIGVYEYDFPLRIEAPDGGALLGCGDPGSASDACAHVDPGL